MTTFAVVLTPFHSISHETGGTLALVPLSDTSWFSEVPEELAGPPSVGWSDGHRFEMPFVLSRPSAWKLSVVEGAGQLAVFPEGIELLLSGASIADGVAPEETAAPEPGTPVHIQRLHGRALVGSAWFRLPLEGPVRMLDMRLRYSLANAVVAGAIARNVSAHVVRVSTLGGIEPYQFVASTFAHRPDEEWPAGKLPVAMGETSGENGFGYVGAGSAESQWKLHPASLTAVRLVPGEGYDFFVQVNILNALQDHPQFGRDGAVFHSLRLDFERLDPNDPYGFTDYGPGLPGADVERRGRFVPVEEQVIRKME